MDERGSLSYPIEAIDLFPGTVNVGCGFGHRLPYDLELGVPLLLPLSLRLLLDLGLDLLAPLSQLGLPALDRGRFVLQQSVQSDIVVIDCISIRINISRY